MQFMQANDVAIHFRTAGLEDGKPVLVFANSLGTDFRIWDGVVAALTPEFAVVLYDMRGHGLSDLGTTPYQMSDHAGDLAALLDHLGITGAVVCGLSVGGQIAQQLYFERPDLVSGLILCDTASQIGTPEFWAQRIAAIETEGLEAASETIITRWFTPAFSAGNGPQYRTYRNMLIRQPVDGYLATCAAIRDFDARDRAGAISVPVQVVVGDADGATPPEIVEAFAASIPGARFDVIAGAGHLPSIEQPERLTQIICNFAQELDARSTPDDA